MTFSAKIEAQFDAWAAGADAGSREKIREFLDDEVATGDEEELDFILQEWRQYPERDAELNALIRAAVMERLASALLPGA